MNLGGLHDSLAQRAQVRRRPLECPSGPQPPDQRESEDVAPRFFLRPAERKGDVECFTNDDPGEEWRRHTDHLVDLAVGEQLAFWSELAAAHLALPKSVAHDRARGRASGGFVLGLEQPAAPRRDSKDRKEFAAHGDALCAPKLACLAESDVPLAPRQHAGEGLLMAAKLFPHRPGDPAVSARIESHSAVAARNPDLDQLMRPIDGQAAQAHGVE